MNPPQSSTAFQKYCVNLLGYSFSYRARFQGQVYLNLCLSCEHVCGHDVSIATRRVRPSLATLLKVMAWNQLETCTEQKERYLKRFTRDSACTIYEKGARSFRISTFRFGKLQHLGLSVLSDAVHHEIQTVLDSDKNIASVGILWRRWKYIQTYSTWLRFGIRTR